MYVCMYVCMYYYYYYYHSCCFCCCFCCCCCCDCCDYCDAIIAIIAIIVVIVIVAIIGIILIVIIIILIITTTTTGPTVNLVHFCPLLRFLHSTSGKLWCDSSVYWRSVNTNCSRRPAIIKQRHDWQSGNWCCYIPHCVWSSPFVVVTYSGIAAGEGRAFSRVRLFVCLSVL